MEQSDAERIEWLLNYIEGALQDAQRDTGCVDYTSAYKSIAELRELTAEG